MEKYGRELSNNNNKNSRDMEKLAANLSTMEKIAEIYRNRHQVALLLPNGLIEVISSEGTLFFARMSAMAKHSIGSKIMTDEIIDLTF